MNGVIVKDPSANPVSGFGDFPYTSELVKERHDVIKCADNKGKLVLMRTRNVGLDQNGAYITKQYPVDLGTIDKVIPGFSFQNKKQCNPCVALNDPPDYSCPFKLDIINVQPGISDVWAQLWGSKK